MSGIGNIIFGVGELLIIVGGIVALAAHSLDERTRDPQGPLL